MKIIFIVNEQTLQSQCQSNKPLLKLLGILEIFKKIIKNKYWKYLIIPIIIKTLNGSVSNRGI